MKLLETNVLFGGTTLRTTSALGQALAEVEEAVRAVDWPIGTGRFCICPERRGNGVSPIKRRFQSLLSDAGWALEHRMELGSRLRPGPVDAAKTLEDGRVFAVEWETGNISSSHRAMNKLALGMLDGKVAAGVLILPTRKLYQYLTDRVGNFEELEPYFPVWRRVAVKRSALIVLRIEQDEDDDHVPRIPKGTDGRALV